jgi:hypothetical protein
MQVPVGPVMVLPHDLELSLDAPKSNVAGFQPVCIHTIERCFISVFSFRPVPTLDKTAFSP